MVADVLGLDPPSLWRQRADPQVDQAANLTIEEVQVVNAMRGAGCVERAKIWAFEMGLAAGGSTAGANAASEIASAVESASLAEQAADSQADSA